MAKKKRDAKSKNIIITMASSIINATNKPRRRTQRKALKKRLKAFYHQDEPDYLEGYYVDIFEPEELIPDE